MIQVIRYKCCMKIFAACVDPVCYTDKKWQKNLRKYVLQGHKPQMLNGIGGIELGECECQNEKPW